MFKDRQTLKMDEHTNYWYIHVLTTSIFNSDTSFVLITFKFISGSN